MAALAENRAQSLLDAGRFTDSETAFVDLAELQQMRGEADSVVADARLRGGEAAYRGEDMRRAWRGAQEAMRRLDADSDDETERALAFRAVQLRALADWRQGRTDRSGRTAAEAMRLAENLGVVEPSVDIALGRTSPRRR